jgi:predicted helicase
MVEKVGDRRCWEQWAKDVAAIAAHQFSDRVQTGAAGRLCLFLDGLQRSINPGIGKEQAVEMLAQHLVTGPVFEALFEGSSFVRSNAVSAAMQNMLDSLKDENLADDSEALRKFYDSVRKRAEGVDNAEGRQRIIIELYDKFFKTAFPKMAEQLGIVYTPVEAVDFIIRSVDDVLRKEFERGVSDENVHILDPFIGTGTFITRLLQSGLIRKEDLARKYKQEIHANEIVLLAYYIAAVNIENVWHDLSGETQYTPFDSICLTDTFQMFEDGGQQALKGFFQENSERIDRQKAAPLRVIIGNPPYSAGQKSANDNAQNRKYDELDRKITKTYAAESTATLKNSLYDSYFRAFRWSSERLNEHGNGGVIAFISNGGWLDGNSADGFRKCLEREFSSVYVFNLRGNQRTSGELSRKEGGKIFGSGSRTPVTITILVKNPAKQAEKAEIFYHDIGDYLTREQKLETLKKSRSVGSPQMPWTQLHPDSSGDWINKGNSVFETFIQIGDKDSKENRAVFFMPMYSNGVKTNRDAWVYNFSRTAVSWNMQESINIYNESVRRYSENKDDSLSAEDFMDFNEKKITWTREIKWDFEKRKLHEFYEN